MRNYPAGALEAKGVGGLFPCPGGSQAHLPTRGHPACSLICSVTHSFGR